MRGVNPISLQRRSKWQQQKKAIVHKFEEQTERVREQTAEYWDQLALPRRKPVQRKEKKIKKIATKTQKERRVDKQKIYKAACKEVDKRDNHTCQHPGCKCKIVQHHHGRFKSQGGQDVVEELVDLCWEHHTGSKESPHQSEYWRIYWVVWLTMKYPEYWEKIREEEKMTQRAVGV
jgi:hypothetical protein